MRLFIHSTTQNNHTSIRTHVHNYSRTLYSLIYKFSNNNSMRKVNYQIKSKNMWMLQEWLECFVKWHQTCKASEEITPNKLKGRHKRTWAETLESITLALIIKIDRIRLYPYNLWICIRFPLCSYNSSLVFYRCTNYNTYL